MYEDIKFYMSLHYLTKMPLLVHTLHSFFRNYKDNQDSYLLSIKYIYFNINDQVINIQSLTKTEDY